MSAEWQTQAPTSWKLSLPCTRAEGEAVALLDEVPGLDPQPVVMASEPDPARPDAWQLDAYLEAAPSPAVIAALRRLVPSAAGVAPVVAPVADADWIAESQRWLTPIRAGRFFVHTAAHAHDIPADAHPFLIEAGRAFGTGHHETTAGCLELLDRLAGEGLAVGNAIDLGTGTGLLAFAVAALWPEARVTATDIDPVAVEVAAANLAANRLPADAVALMVADGTDAPAITAGAPYDLVVANILAGPLIRLAPAIAGILAANGTVLLAGLLATQSADVLSAYRAAGIASVRELRRGDWSVLALRRG